MGELNSLIKSLFFSFTKKSENSKTGPIPVSYTSSHTCPTSCGLFNSCYAKAGKVAIHWRKLSKGLRGIRWPEFIRTVSDSVTGKLWRHNIAGDLPGIDASIHPVMMRQLTEASKQGNGFTFTHKPVLDGPHARANRKIIEHANSDGFTVNLSANHISEVDKLIDLSIAPVVTVLPQWDGLRSPRTLETKKGNRIVVCHAVPSESRQTCLTCGLCAQASRSLVVGFPVHGTLKKHWPNE